MHRVVMKGSASGGTRHCVVKIGGIIDIRLAAVIEPLSAEPDVWISDKTGQ